LVLPALFIIFEDMTQLLLVFFFLSGHDPVAACLEGLLEPGTAADLIVSSATNFSGGGGDEGPAGICKITYSILSLSGYCNAEISITEFVLVVMFSFGSAPHALMIRWLRKKFEKGTFW
jgi:hypothetical protein